MIYPELAQLEAKGTPIRVGVSGAGWIGRNGSWLPTLAGP